MKNKGYNNILSVLIKVAYIIFIIVFYPLYLFNKYDFKKNTKKNPFYKSIFVRLSEKYPFIYEKSMFVLNFPNPTCVYRILPELKGRVLQVGCGTGLLNKFYRKNSQIEFVNLDVNKKYLEYGLKKKRFSTYIHSDICKVTLEDKSFDTVIFARCFHHIRNHKKALAECSRLINNEGVIIISDPVILQEDKSGTHMAKGYMVNSSIDGVIWRFTKSTLLEHIKSCLPPDLIIKSVEDVRQLHITNYNLKYPQTDILVVLEKTNKSIL